MSTTALRTAVNGTKEPKSFPALLEQMKPQIALALPKHINADRMSRIALTAFRQSPQLAKCEPYSIIGAIVTLSQLGLEPGVMGQAYLVPYKGQCQGIPGWKGLVDLVSRAGRATVHTGAVFEGDFFEYEMGSSPFVKHRPSEEGDNDPASLTHTYAVGWVKGAERPVIEVWSAKKLKRHRDRYNRVGPSHYSFQNWEMYARKIPLLQVIKYLPVSVEVQTALDLSSMADAGQTIDAQQAISGTWTAMDADSAALPVPHGVDPQTGEILDERAAIQAE